MSRFRKLSRGSKREVTSLGVSEVSILIIVKLEKLAIGLALFLFIS